jgi:hypothetical protein
MSLIQINIVFNEQTEQLEVSPAQVNLNHGDVVHWVLSGERHDDRFPQIIFQTQANAQGQQFGPFEYLEPSLSGVIGLGNTGHSGSYPYTVLLLDEHGPVGTPASASIDNASSLLNTSPQAIIRFDSETQKLNVEPPHLLVELKHTAIWHIQGIPQDCFITFHFDDPAHPIEGPFLSFSLSRDLEDSDRWLATGTGLLFDVEPSLLPFSIGYSVALRDAQGNVLTHTPDPVIEPLGPPISSSTE